jgi:hypothetical protein
VRGPAGISNRGFEACRGAPEIPRLGTTSFAHFAFFAFSWTHITAVACGPYKNHKHFGALFEETKLVVRESLTEVAMRQLSAGHRTRDVTLRYIYEGSGPFGLISRRQCSRIAPATSAVHREALLKAPIYFLVSAAEQKTALDPQNPGLRGLWKG